MVTVIDPNVVDWANLSTMIGSIPTIFPGIIALITGLLPLIFIGAIIGLVIGLFDSIVGMIGNLSNVFKK